LVLFNYALKELTAKIVYYGPGLSGKTSNLQYIYEELPIKNKGRMLTLATETDRTLYFDFLPVDAGVVRGIKTRVQLYTVPGQVFYNATRRMVLKGADGVVFVADSQKGMNEANLESLDNLRENLKAHDLKLEEMPIVLQFNKRDLQDICTLEEMNEVLNKMNAPFYEAVAKDGIGVEETLQAISGLVLKSVIDRYGGDRSMAPMRRAANDPARTDPDALVSAAASVGGLTSELAKGESELPRMKSGSGGGLAKDTKARGTTWQKAAEVSKVGRSDDSNPLDAFESLNIEGILDEALKLDESDDKPARSTPARRQHDTAPGRRQEDEEDSMFSGLLDEALGAQETASILDDVLGSSSGPATDPRRDALSTSDPIRDIEAELLAESPESSYGVDAPRRDLSELIKTRVSIPADRVTTNAPKGSSAKARDPIEVPVTVEVDADALGGGDIELLLKIRLKPKKR
jgi:small GTP-binding protein